MTTRIHATTTNASDPATTTHIGVQPYLRHVMSDGVRVDEKTGRPLVWREEDSRWVREEETQVAEIPGREVKVA